jgi:hypothetical protein
VLYLIVPQNDEGNRNIADNEEQQETRLNGSLHQGLLLNSIRRVKGSF